jgi:8-oxo-dGTP diphosphatase
MEKQRPKVGVGIMILNNRGEVLLGKRHDDAEKASSDLHGEGAWTMPGGKLDFQETLIDGAIRETAEECKDCAIMKAGKRQNENL